MNNTMSFCGDCLHQKVCRYAKEIEAYEAKSPLYSAVPVGSGPTIRYSIDCPAKMTKNEEVTEEKTIWD